jgi:hypothetical protein
MSEENTMPANPEPDPDPDREPGSDRELEREPRPYSRRRAFRGIADVLKENRPGKSEATPPTDHEPDTASEPDPAPDDANEPDPAPDDANEPPKPKRNRNAFRITPEPGWLRAVGSGDDEHPPFKPHAEWDESGCPGMLRFIERTGEQWIVECDYEPCRFGFGVPRVKFDRDYRRQVKSQRACLPERFVGVSVVPTPGNQAALKQIAAVAARWGTPNCPRPPMLVGPPGRGKTHLITAALVLLIERHEADVWYLTVSDLLEEAKRNMETKEPVRPVFDRAASVPLLALDDLGADALGQWGRNELQALVDRRHRRSLPIIGASNIPVAQWDRAFGDRVASRLHDLSRPTPVTGEDWRRKT